MTKKVLISLLAVGVLFTAGVAAQAQQQINLGAYIPFTFTVGDKVMPAGTYRISEPANNMVRVCGEDCFAIATTNIGWVNPNNTDSKLVFLHHGGDYKLAQVWMHEQGRKVPAGKHLMSLASAHGPEQLEIISLR